LIWSVSLITNAYDIRSWIWYRKTGAGFLEHVSYNQAPLFLAPVRTEFYSALQGTRLWY